MMDFVDRGKEDRRIFYREQEKGGILDGFGERGCLAHQYFNTFHKRTRAKLVPFGDAGFLSSQFALFSLSRFVLSSVWLLCVSVSQLQEVENNLGTFVIPESSSFTPQICSFGTKNFPSFFIDQPIDLDRFLGFIFCIIRPCC